MPDTAYMASQSDPENNRHFRRRWGEPFESLPLPNRLDRQADALIMQGNRSHAETLAHRAAELRLAGVRR